MSPMTMVELVNELIAATAQRDLALAACRSIRFAVKNAKRHGGEYNLNDLEAADRLAKEALSGGGK